MAFKIKTFEQLSYSMINWMNNLSRGLNDFTIGSKIRTLLESVSLELEELYYRTYNATQEAQAEGVYEAFDFPRKPAAKAIGWVTFYQSTPNTSEDITIPIGQQVSTIGSENIPEISFETLTDTTIFSSSGIIEDIRYSTGINNYTLSQRLVDSVTSIVGTLSGGSHTFVEGVDYELVQDTTEARIEWYPVGDLPDNATIFAVSFVPLSADVQVISLDPGTASNVSSGTVTRIKVPILGISGITNYEAVTSGANEETDDERKARFSTFIEGLARGTVAALRYAVYNKTKKYKVHSAYLLENEPVPGFVKIYITDSAGTASDAMVADVVDAVEAYRGAGVVVGIAKPTKVLIDVYCKLRIAEGYNKAIIAESIQTIINDHLSGYKFLGDTGYSTLYLTNLQYIIKSARPDAIIEADLSFKRSTDDYNNPSNPLLDPNIVDITPVMNATIGEVFKPNNIEVLFYS